MLELVRTNLKLGAHQLFRRCPTICGGVYGAFMTFAWKEREERYVSAWPFERRIFAVTKNFASILY